MCPLHEGTSAGFWDCACKIDLSGKSRNWWGGFYPPRDGWYIYYYQDLHGQSLFRVSHEEAIQDFPRVVALLKQLEVSTNTPPITKWAKAALANPAAENAPEIFLSQIREAHLNQIKHSDEQLYNYVLDEERSFIARWERAQRYWLNILFETVFFAALILFVLWPWMRGSRTRRCYIHLALVPLLLILPYYFGYCGWTFTSVGPNGGILYPWIIVWFRGCCFWTPMDEWLLNASPKILAPISQNPGPMISVSGGQPPGIIAALLFGCIIAVLFFELDYFRRKKFAPSPD